MDTVVVGVAVMREARRGMLVTGTPNQSTPHPRVEVGAKCIHFYIVLHVQQMNVIGIEERAHFMHVPISSKL